MFEFVKSETYSVVFSVILGMGIIAVLRPTCTNESCVIKKAPSTDEVINTTYQIGSKCYKFTTNMIDCPEKGVIEPFETRPLGGFVTSTS
jgi:hypothetical protein